MIMESLFYLWKDSHFQNDPHLNLHDQTSNPNQIPTWTFKPSFNPQSDL